MKLRDWLHGTLRLNVPHDAITIGVPAYREAEEVTLPKVLVMPFEEQRDSWRLPGDHPSPGSGAAGAAPTLTSRSASATRRGSLRTPLSSCDR